MNASQGQVAVDVRLYGALRRYRPPDAPGPPHHPFSIYLSPGQSVNHVVAVLGIPDGLVNAAAVNGEATELSTGLQDGDTVALFPQSAGGCPLGGSC